MGTKFAFPRKSHWSNFAGKLRQMRAKSSKVETSKRNLAHGHQIECRDRSSWCLKLAHFRDDYFICSRTSFHLAHTISIPNGSYYKHSKWLIFDFIPAGSYYKHSTWLIFDRATLITRMDRISFSHDHILIQLSRNLVHILSDSGPCRISSVLMVFHLSQTLFFRISIFLCQSKWPILLVWY